MTLERLYRIELIEKRPGGRVRLLFLALCLSFIGPSISLADQTTAQPGEALKTKARPVNLAKSPIKEMAGRVIVDAQLEVTQPIQIDKKLNFVALSTPTATPSTGHADLWLNNGAKQLCTKFDDGTTACLSSGGASGTITGVTAGTGLTGGGTTGSITVALSTPVSVANGGTNSTTALGNSRLMGSVAGKVVESSIYYDSTNSRIGIGNTNASYPIQVGGTAPSAGQNAQVVVSSTFAGSGNGHGFAEYSVFQAAAGGAYAGYDSRVLTAGTSNYDHVVSFQSNIGNGSSGVLSKNYSFYSSPAANAGTTTNVYGLFADDTAGAGAVTNQYGVYISTLTKGTTKYPIYVADVVNPSYMPGGIKFLDGTVMVSSPVASSGASLSSTQTFTGGNTFSSPSGVVVTSISFSNTATGGIKGTTTNDSAPSGTVGEYKSSSFQNVSSTSSGNIGDYTSISLAAGDWDVTACVDFEINGANVTGIIYFISTTSGASFAGTTQGDNLFDLGPAITGGGSSMCISNWRLSHATTESVYFKMDNTFTVATPKIYGRISARRIR